jgi:hypothetical protein
MLQSRSLGLEGSNHLNPPDLTHNPLVPIELTPNLLTPSDLTPNPLVLTELTPNLLTPSDLTHNPITPNSNLKVTNVMNNNQTTDDPYDCIDNTAVEITTDDPYDCIDNTDVEMSIPVDECDIRVASSSSHNDTHIDNPKTNVRGEDKNCGNDNNDNHNDVNNDNNNGDNNENNIDCHVKDPESSSNDDNNDSDPDFALKGDMRDLLRLLRDSAPLTLPP